MMALVDLRGGLPEFQLTIGNSRDCIPLLATSVLGDAYSPSLSSKTNGVCVHCVRLPFVSLR